MAFKTINKVGAFLQSASGQRFIKLVGMLGSDGPGERANASAMANKLLKEADLTWAEVMGGQGGGGARASDGGQTQRIRSLESQLATVNSQLKITDALSRNLRLKVSELERRVYVSESQLAAARRDLKNAGTAKTNPEADKKSKPANGERKYETPLQKQLNELIDEIELNVELNDWETGFLTSIRDLKWKITEKQWNRLKVLAKQADIDPDAFVDPL